ncbi:hypothetical protein [Mycobacterium sp. URHB0021]|jgi:hypothetical protein
MVPDAVGPHPRHETFADELLDHALLGDVTGKTVLDALRPGLYAEELTARGAHVIGSDQSPRMAELCRQLVASGRFRTPDLAEPLDWLLGWIRRSCPSRAGVGIPR